jgi:hypothetical protein
MIRDNRARLPIEGNQLDSILGYLNKLDDEVESLAQINQKSLEGEKKLAKKLSLSKKIISALLEEKKRLLEEIGSQQEYWSLIKTKFEEAFAIQPRVQKMLSDIDPFWRDITDFIQRKGVEPIQSFQTGSNLNPKPISDCKNCKRLIKRAEKFEAAVEEEMADLQTQLQQLMPEFESWREKCFTLEQENQTLREQLSPSTIKTRFDGLKPEGFARVNSERLFHKVDNGKRTPNFGGNLQNVESENRTQKDSYFTHTYDSGHSYARPQFNGNLTGAIGSVQNGPISNGQMTVNTSKDGFYSQRNF